MQSEDESYQYSYFQIAGIHGLPDKSWDYRKDEWTGWYCTHGTTLFPTWHRPYVLLFEVSPL